MVNLSLLKLPAVEQATGKKKSRLYTDIHDGVFPRPVKIGLRAVAWPSTEVEAVNAARIAGKSEEEIRELVAALHSQRQQAA